MGPLSRRDLIKRFRALGWEGPRQGRRHAFMVSGDRKVRIPNPHESDISPALVAEIVKQAQIPRIEWDNAK